MRGLDTVILAALLLAAPLRAAGLRGYLAIQGERVLASEGAELLFTPASVQKIVVAAAALHYLGHDHQIETLVRARGAQQDGVLHGDLVLEAAGDPTWSRVFFPDDPEAPFRALAEQVSRAGVTRVDGDLAVDVSRFPGRRSPTSRSQIELGLALGAPVSGLAVDENVVDIHIAPGRRVGDRASVAVPAGVELRNDTVTVSGARHGKGSVEFLPQWGDGAIRVRGEYPLSEPSYTVSVSLPSPERTAGERLREHLRRAGVEVRGAVRLEEKTGSTSPARPLAAGVGGVAGGGSRASAPGSDAVLGRLFSPPLSEIVTPILRDSSNWTAEMLLLQVALARTGEGRYDDGVEALEAFLVDEVGVAENLFAFDDGSGLSPDNLLSPQAVVSLLRFAWRAPWRDAFLAALARPGAGTLAAWPALPQVAAKTGTLRHTLALAGMLGTDDSAATSPWTALPLPPGAAAAALGAEVAAQAAGVPTAAAPGAGAPAPMEPILFAVFLNHDLRDRGAQRREIAELVRSWRRLAGSS